ncbi:hypothetical protein [Spirillospora sp. CA-294931]|uniref:hypothetical protein n=1 Tax=Spirillospora sp. CA-294931 TaxID=3240042 RepID=UPI003D93F555
MQRLPDVAPGLLHGDTLEGGWTKRTYEDAATDGADGLSRLRTYETCGRPHRMIGESLAVFVGDGPYSALRRAIAELRLHKVDRAWTGGMVDLTNEEIDARVTHARRTLIDQMRNQGKDTLLAGLGLDLSLDFVTPRAVCENAPRTAPLLVLQDRTPGYRFEDADPGERWDFIAAMRRPVGEHTFPVRLLEDGPRTRVSANGERKVGARLILGLLGEDGSKVIVPEARVRADMFTTWDGGAGRAGDWARDRRRTVSAGVTIRDASGYAMSARHDGLAEGTFSRVLTFGDRLESGQSYTATWWFSKPEDTRSRSLTVEGRLEFTA